ncbi:MAG: hypothetical protein KIG22_01895, partial [Oxalobacter sp.]|nr:hypothetical protein [Oxalobacter sp.]
MSGAVCLLVVIAAKNIPNIGSDGSSWQYCGFAFPKQTVEAAMPFTELASFLQGLSDPHILFDTQY